MNGRNQYRHTIDQAIWQLEAQPQRKEYPAAESGSCKNQPDGAGSGAGTGQAASTQVWLVVGIVDVHLLSMWEQTENSTAAAKMTACN